ncbi:hypothetical protein B0H15DRAFT_61204 [Mycena belliarum]|uniref:F-box domain-containing protein n=1 Tax=Mycena belliarum TaxID=1033014 RepID=A0AAD6TP62_9AGAR|nr:hypothetical protein B0H15DRAFT_61204 [Mycena belliae]
MSLSTAARDTVMATPELLALVLVQLPLRDLLLRAPLVCKMWHATTLTPALQRALFLAPDLDPFSDSVAAPVRNPLLAELFPPFFTTPGPNRWSWPDAHALMAMPCASALAAFRRPDASWRRMLVAQPPPHTMHLIQKCHARGGDRERRAELRELELRMGPLYDLAVQFLERVTSHVCITWHEGVGRKADLTLETVYTVQCVAGRAGPLREGFHGHGQGPRPEFGEWVRVERAS